MNQTMITCKYCQREWDGNAQCPCWIDLTEDYPSLSDSDENMKLEHQKLKKQHYERCINANKKCKME